MPTVAPVVRANVLSEYGRFLEPAGVDPAQLLSMVGLTFADIEDPERYISLNTVAELFDVTARHTKDANFGLRYACAYPPGGTGLFGHLMLTAPTVGDVLKVIEQYIEVHARPLRIRLEDHGGTHAFFLGFPPSFTAPQMQYIGFLFAALVLRLRQGAGQHWCPYAVEFAHRQPADLREYHRYFGLRLTFDAPRYRLDVSAEDFDKPMPQFMARLAESMRDLGNRVLSEARARQDIAEQTFETLTDQLESEQPFDLETIASVLKVPTRALQWRLEQSGTSYERLLARTRRRMTLRLLRDTDLTMSHVAMRLGYSDASAFSRAAQTWYKETPSALRRKLREDGPALEAFENIEE